MLDTSKLSAPVTRQESPRRGTDIKVKSYMYISYTVSTGYKVNCTRRTRRIQYVEQ